MTNNQTKPKDPAQQRIERLERTSDILRHYLIESLEINISMIETVSEFTGIDPQLIPAYNRAKTRLASLKQTSPINT